MPLGRQYADAIHRIAEPRQGTVAAARFESFENQERAPVGFSDGELQARATHGRWNDTFFYPARSHVNTYATMGLWPEDLPAEPLQPRATHGHFDQTDNDPDLDYVATEGLMT